MADVSPGQVVLIADDDPNALSGYVELLEQAGLVVFGCATAPEALALARETVPDVVVTDVAMPSMDGFALSEALRSEVLTRYVPIVGMTGHWNPEIQQVARRAGMVAMLLKPFLPAHLLAEVDRALRHGRAVAGALGREPSDMETALPVGLGRSARRHLGGV